MQPSEAVPGIDARNLQEIIVFYGRSRWGNSSWRGCNLSWTEWTLELDYMGEHWNETSNMGELRL